MSATKTTAIEPTATKVALWKERLLVGCGAAIQRLNDAEKELEAAQKEVAASERKLQAAHLSYERAVAEFECDRTVLSQELESELWVYRN